MEEKNDQFNLDDLDNLNFDDLAGNSSNTSSNNIPYYNEEYDNPQLKGNIFTVLSTFFAFMVLFLLPQQILLRNQVCVIFCVVPLLFIAFLVVCKNFNLFALHKIPETIVLFGCYLLYFIFGIIFGWRVIFQRFSIVVGITILVTSILKIISNYIKQPTLFKWINFALYIIAAIFIFVNMPGMRFGFGDFRYIDETTVIMFIPLLLSLAFSELAQKDI